MAGWGGEIERFTHDGACLVAEAGGPTRAETTYLLVHGIGLGRSVFDDLAALLCAQARVVTIDLPGYGEAPEPARTPTIERMADLVAAYVRHLGRGPVVLVGHSLGSQVVTEVAVRHPSTARALVLVAPTVDRRHRSAGAQLWRLGRDLLDESPKVLILGAREYLRAGPNLRRKMRAMLTHRPEDAYPRVAAPALVLRGERDPVSPRAWCAEVTAALPDARAVEVAGRGHETLIQDAADAAAAITAFLARAAAGPSRPHR